LAVLKEKRKKIEYKLTTVSQSGRDEVQIERYNSTYRSDIKYLKEIKSTSNMYPCSQKIPFRFPVSFLPCLSLRASIRMQSALLDFDLTGHATGSLRRMLCAKKATFQFTFPRDSTCIAYNVSSGLLKFWNALSSCTPPAISWAIVKV
jgi:hypothetical protein